MSDNGLQRQLEKIQELNEPLRQMTLAYVSMYSAIRNMIKESLMLEGSMNELKVITNDKLDEQEILSTCDILKNFAELYEIQTPQSTDSRITTLKSQLKHCKNYLERQNIERELNRLYKERINRI